MSVSLGAHALTVPWYPGAVGNRFNPALLVGTDRTIRDGERWRLYLTLNLGVFREHWWMSGVSVDSEVGVSRRLPAGLHADFRLGLGYLHYFWRRERLELRDGEWVRADAWGSPSLLVPVSLVVGHQGHPDRPAAVAPFVAARWGVQALFLEEAPVLTHLQLLAGVRVQPRPGRGRER